LALLLSMLIEITAADPNSGYVASAACALHRAIVQAASGAYTGFGLISGGDRI
jgi:hypothetical protein